VPVNVTHFSQKDIVVSETFVPLEKEGAMSSFSDFVALSRREATWKHYVQAHLVSPEGAAEGWKPCADLGAVIGREVEAIDRGALESMARRLGWYA
jgi:hypothetical protein